jgi:hypothetical protein
MEKEFYFAAARHYNLDYEEDHDSMEIYKELFVNKVNYDNCYVEPLYEFIIKCINENKFVIKEVLNTAMIKPDTIIHLNFENKDKPNYKIYDINPEFVTSHATVFMSKSEYDEMKRKYEFFKSLNDNKMGIYKIISNIKKKYNLKYEDFIELSKI